jgi:hypothetical protein
MTEVSSFAKLVRFPSFPEVITLAPVKDLKDRLRKEGDSPSRKTEAELRALLELYFIDHPDNRRAWESILTSLARVEGPGRGFLISGAYGSGKSHLLAALSLLAECPGAWNHFLHGHPWARNFGRAFGPARRLLAVEVPLDSYRGSAHALESVVFRCIEDELRRRLGEDAPALVDETAYLEAFEKLVLPHRSKPFADFASEHGETREWKVLAAEDRAAALRLAREFMRSHGIDVAIERPRGATLGLVREAIRGAGYSGLVLLLDELSLFLASKDKRGLDEDASFLQFLGQQAGQPAASGARPAPLWIIAAAQRNLEDVGDIDSHSLRQIRDRYERHHLSLAQLRTVVERKLVEKPDAHAFAAAVRDACAEWSAGNGQMRFRPEELARTYPFNPLALDAFEGAAESFLSQTRSVVQVVGHAVSSGRLAAQPRALISADAAFDFAAERFEGRPELHRFEAARRFYAENAKRVAPQEAELVVAVFKALALAALGGTRWMVSEIADALAGSPVRNDEGPAFYGRVEAALKAMRRRGAYVECAGQPGEFVDQYYLEVASDIGEALRRRLYEIVDSLSADDSRVFDSAAAACQDASFPLGLLGEPRPQQLGWMNTVRRVTVERRDLRRVRAEELLRLADALASPVTPECGWLVVADLRDTAGQAEAWKQACSQASGRWTQAMMAWLPRALTDDEADALREQAALRMLAADPTAREGEHGRELARLVAERVALQSVEAERIVRTAYLQGEIVRIDGRHADLSRVTAADTWEDIVAAVFDWPLRELFPRFRDIAPRKRLAGKQRSTFVIEQFLRPGSAMPPPDSALEDALSSYLEPLGLARLERGRWSLSVRDSAVAEAVLQLVPARSSPDALSTEDVIRFSDCGATVEKSELGLTPEIIELVVGSLVRAGYLVALDGFIKPIPFAQLGTPLSDHVAYVARSTPLRPEHERAALAVAQALFAQAPPSLDLEQQAELWDRLCAWARETAVRAQDIERSLVALYAALGQGPAEWAESRRALVAALELAAAITPDADAADGLAAVADLAARIDLALLARLAALGEFMREDADAVALMWRYLNDERLKVGDAAVSSSRDHLRGVLAQGEAMVDARCDLRKAMSAFLAGYASAYQRHHAQVHSVERFRAYADLRRSPEFRASLVLAPVGLPGNRAGVIEAKLRAQMERHCAGGRIADALRRQPVCPDCGLLMGQDIELVKPEEILADCRPALAEELAELVGCRPRLDAALGAEPDAAKAQTVRRALELTADAGAEAVLDAFSPPVVDWIAAALRTGAAPRARIAELHAFLRGKRLTRAQALRAFADWLSAHGVPNDADAVEFE